MRFRVAFLLLIFVFAGVSFAHTSRNISKNGYKTISRVTDPSYSSALAAANRFLHAWQTQDHETGIMMLTDSARQQASRDRLQEFFSPGPDAAFEIQRGRKLSSGEYVFPAVLFDVVDSSARAHTCLIVITKAGRDDWAVNQLP